VKVNNPKCKVIPVPKHQPWRCCLNLSSS